MYSDLYFGSPIPHMYALFCMEKPTTQRFNVDAISEDFIDKR